MYDRGQATPLLVVVVALGGVSALLMTQVGLRAVERAKAQTAADAVVLAVAAGDEALAVDVARMNGAAAVDIITDSDSAEVRVERPGLIDGGSGQYSVSASARAQRSTSIRPTPAMMAVLDQATTVLGRPIVPRSLRDGGSVIVVSPQDGADLDEHSESVGLCRLNSDSDLLSFEVCTWTKAT